MRSERVQKSPTERPRITGFRSLADNDPRRLPSINGRSADARRYRDLVEALTSDFDRALTQAELLIVRQAAALITHAEQVHAAIIRGENVSAEDSTRLANSAHRLLSALTTARNGPRRAGRPSRTSTLQAYLSKRRP